MSRDFAVEYGTFLGILWSATFFLLTNGMVNNNIILSFFGMMFMGVLLFMPIYFAWRFKQHFEIGTQCSFGVAWTFSSLMFLYASLLTGVVEFLYFRYMDHGELLDVFYNTLAMPEIVAQYKAMGAMDVLNTAKSELDVIASLSPLDLTLNLFADNIMVGIILSIPASIVAHRKSRDIRPAVNKLKDNFREK